MSGQEEVERRPFFGSFKLQTQSPVEIAITQGKQQAQVCVGRVWLSALVYTDLI